MEANSIHIQRKINVRKVVEGLWSVEICSPRWTLRMKEGMQSTIMKDKWMIWGRRYPGQNDFGSFFQLRREKIAGIERCWKEKLALFFFIFLEIPSWWRKDFWRISEWRKILAYWERLRTFQEDFSRESQLLFFGKKIPCFG